MKVYGAPTSALAEIGSELGIGVEWKPNRRAGKRGKHIALRPLGKRYAVTIEFDDDTEQTVVCQHGHEAFLLALFERFPNATVTTTIAVYRGIDDFIAIQPSVRAKYLKVYGADPCGCEPLPHAIVEVVGPILQANEGGEE